MKILLLSGPMASGKTLLAAELIGQHGFKAISSSAFLRAQAALQGKPADRTTLQELGDNLDVATDFGWVIDLVANPAFVADPNQTKWLFDAVRKERQVEHFRSHFAQAVLHVHLHADPCVLKMRYASRGRGVSEPTIDYEIAEAHPNEVSARNMLSIADRVFRTDELDAAEIARLINSGD